MTLALDRAAILGELAQIAQRTLEQIRAKWPQAAAAAREALSVLGNR